MSDNPFVRWGHVDKPGIVGSHWWNKELAAATSLRSRRGMLVALAVSAGGIATLGVVGFALAGDDTREERRRSLDLQRDHGWSFGATSETVAFDWQYTTAYARDALPRLVNELTPLHPDLRPWFVPALFQSVDALPRVVVPGETALHSLGDALRPIHTPGMIDAEAAGLALAELLAQADSRVALVFDLDGPASVAAAAGAAGLHDPVFLFDNWPHPRGVVKAHLTLAAAVYHQPRFAQTRKERRVGAPPAFVLDRQRLAPYSDDSTQFDNRWLAKLPLATVLQTLEIKRLLYVVATQSSPIDLRDVGHFLKQWSGANMDVRAIALDAFSKDTRDGKVRFGGSPEMEAGFFGHYGWKLPTPKAVPVVANVATAAWRPSEPATDPADKTLGTTPVTVNAETGVVLGPRNGSLNRTSSGSWGGG